MPHPSPGLTLALLTRAAVESREVGTVSRVSAPEALKTPRGVFPYGKERQSLAGQEEGGERKQQLSLS